MPSSFPILLIDDDPDVAAILNRAARSEFVEAEFIHITHFLEAVGYLEGMQGLGPRLVLLDVDLQTGLSGLDFLTLLRGHAQGRLVPVVVLSANQKYQGEAYVRGANAFTHKPFTYAGWQAYVKRLRQYWFETTTTPILWFDSKSE